MESNGVRSESARTKVRHGYCRASMQHEVSAKVLHVIMSDLLIQIILLEHHLKTYINTFGDSGKIIYDAGIIGYNCTEDIIKYNI